MCIRDSGCCIEFYTFFLSFRNGIIDNYAELFGGSGGDEFSAISQFNKKWGWYQSVFSLSQGDIGRFKNITQLNVHECLYALSFMKEKADLESKQMKSKFKR